MLRKLAICAFVIALFVINIGADVGTSTPQSTSLDVFSPEFECKEGCKVWSDSIFNSLTLDQKIGQLFFVDAYARGNHLEENKRLIEELIQDYHIGGLIFFRGGPKKQAELTNHYQNISKLPLLIAMDMEWGLGMRLDSTISFPRQMTLGAIEDNSYIYKMGEEIAKQSKRLGVHINFAPVIDINVNRLNPVIGRRSFGSNLENVTEKGLAYMKGLQDNGMIACAKHFPGHGDTDSDSHLTLPIINHSKERLDSIELYPFKRLIADSLISLMVAHLYIPSYDTTTNRATTLSPNVVNGLLKDSLGFKGLVFSDALDMQGVTMYYEPGEVEVKALLAGNDVLIKPDDAKIGIEAIKEAVQAGLIPVSLIDEKVKKILKVKYFSGLVSKPTVDESNLDETLNKGEALALKAKLYEQAVTVLKNDSNFIPIKDINAVESYACINFGDSIGNTFQKMVSRYAEVENYALTSELIIENKPTLKDSLDLLYEKLKDKEVIMASFYGLNVEVDTLSEDQPQRHGLNYHILDFINKLDKRTNVIISGFANLYGLRYFEDNKHLICGYESDSLMQTIVPQIIFGSLGSKGKLPADVSDKLTLGTGIETDTLGRIGFAVPESVGMDSKTLNMIDSVVNKALEGQATPGCQVLIAKDGKIVKIDSYGYHTYEKKIPVTDRSIYDIASITKVVASLQVAMQLEEQGKINLDKPIGKYLPSLKKTDKKHMLLKEVLTHQAGLTPYIEYWKDYTKDKKLDTLFFSDKKTQSHPVQVTPNLYTVENIDDLMWETTKSSELRKKNKDGKYGYKYSDLTFYVMHRIIDREILPPMEEYLTDNIYKPLGLTTMTYRPLERFSKEQITPTEMDIDFRNTLVHGTVHDPGAALKGGVAGHAGVFSNAFDLAVLMQMNLQDGYYAGKRYLKPGTVKRFNSRPYKEEGNRRGIGWDKPVMNNHGGPTSNLCSQETFGHSGFTGTCTWADPENNIVYVFLSNRVYPLANNWKLVRTNVRTDIHDLIYQSLKTNNK